MVSRGQKIVLAVSMVATFTLVACGGAETSKLLAFVVVFAVGAIILLAVLGGGGGGSPLAGGGPRYQAPIARDKRKRGKKK